MMFSILIPTLDRRKSQFERLSQKLESQVVDNDLRERVEILHLRDNGELSIGYKRNVLLEKARGIFVAFVDDDDDVSDNYVRLVCNIIRKEPHIDCIGIKGIVTYRGKNPHVFIHSIKYNKYSSQKGVYYRPPYHLNPIRAEIAGRFRFEHIDYSEDIDWGMRICRAGALKVEVLIREPIYFYLSQRFWAYQWLLDQTEWFRHPLGLQLANRVRLKRWLRSGLFHH